MAIPSTDGVQGQPVRTINNGDVVSAICDGTTVSQKLGVDASGRITIKLDDGSGNAITSQINGSQRALDVGINVGGAQIDPRQIRALTASDVVTANQGTAASTHAGYWWARLTDGTNDGVFAAASTAAATSQAAFVVALSPNSPLPAGGNTIGAVNQGTSPWVVKDQADGPVAPGTAASFSQLAGGVYNSSAISLTTGQQAALQLTAAGALIIRPLSASTDTVVSNQGTANTVANAWPTKITDGTNTAAVKAASTPAASTDPALVVALSPNTPLPAGTAVIGAVNQGTSPWVTSDQADGPVSPGTAATKSMLGGGVYNSSAISMTTGQQAALQLDSDGALKVRVSATIPGNPVNNYFMSATNVAYGASDTHTYTITTGKTLNIKKVFAAASGRIRIDVQTSPDGSTFTTVFTAYNSTSNPNITIDLDEFYVPDSGTGSKVQIVRYNEEPGTTFGISSTISGTEN